jgi:hypothetical protein
LNIWLSRKSSSNFYNLAHWTGIICTHLKNAQKGKDVLQQKARIGSKSNKIISKDTKSRLKGPPWGTLITRKNNDNNSLWYIELIKKKSMSS